MEAAAGRAAGIGWETGPGVRAEVGGKVGIGGGGLGGWGWAGWRSPTDLFTDRNNKKLLWRVKDLDRHCNMVLEVVKEMWTELPK